jgi:hypothetical protein
MGAYGGGAETVAGATPTVSPEVANTVALDASVTGQIPGQSGTALTPVQQAALDPNAGLAGTTPGMPTPPPPPTAAGSAAASLPAGEARNAALNKLADPSTSFGNAPGINAEQSLYQAENLARPTEVGNIYPDIQANTVKTAAVDPSYYSTMGTPGKLMTQALPGMTADIGMNQNNTGVPGEEPYQSASTLSPNFQGYTPRQPKPYYQAQYTRYAANGGLMALAAGGSAEEKKKKQRAILTADRTMAAMSADQAGLANLNNARYAANMTGASPLRSSMSLGDLPTPVGAARGGLADLGGYSDGGRMLKGPGDGMSDSIPAMIGRKQPARLADGEFVVPADVVSHLGNGSTDAGAKRLYAMMDRARQARTGKKKQAPAVNADKILSRVA